MSSSSDSEERMYLERFEQQGVETVRLTLGIGRFPPNVEAAAIRWIAQKDRESRSRSEASQASQERTALSAKKAAWIAAIAAIVAAIIAIIGTVITLLAWIWPQPTR